ncbi:nucleotidyltransferase domain-containing protein [Methylonatrum kenyense]|uniref:type VII toxin-antitoxin system MntA family adenylyltransferase antitoxin n=1 Tax=Methylonatrum kenyense TaxID=455253 RepID=UPI0020C0BA57|nr:nucleotidyltransferase domain-containing protein [Methylonatrum kenyense]MCK8516955.1 nucleotidyltransferase domain-containing protein [Methylonatrum kenyense]
MSELRDSTMVLDRVREVVSADENVLVAIVFGSVGSGHHGPESDLDVAVLGRSPLSAERRARLIRQLAAEAGRPVDLVDLRTAGLPVLRSALAGGKRILCKDQAAYAGLVSRMLLDNADFEPYRSRMLQERRNAWIP